MNVKQVVMSWKEDSKETLKFCEDLGSEREANKITDAFHGSVDSYLFKDATKSSLPATICSCNCNIISEDQIFYFLNSESRA